MGRFFFYAYFFGGRSRKKPMLISEKVLYCFQNFLKILVTLLATPITLGLIAKIARAWLLSADRTWKTGGDRNLIANFELYPTLIAGSQFFCDLRGAWVHPRFYKQKCHFFNKFWDLQEGNQKSKNLISDTCMG